MREFQEKNKYKKILYSKGMVIVLMLLILVGARATYGVYQKEKESSGNTLRATAELARLEERNMLLQSETARLSTDEGVEEEIRAKYGVSKPGEEMIIIVDQAQGSTTSKQVPQSWWDKVKSFFK